MTREGRSRAFHANVSEGFGPHTVFFGVKAWIAWDFLRGLGGNRGKHERKRLCHRRIYEASLFLRFGKETRGDGACGCWECRLDAPLGRTLTGERRREWKVKAGLLPSGGGGGSTARPSFCIWCGMLMERGVGSREDRSVGCRFVVDSAVSSVVTPTGPSSP